MYYLCIREAESEQTRITDEATTIEFLIKLAEAEIGNAWTWWIEDEEGNEIYQGCGCRGEVAQLQAEIARLKAYLAADEAWEAMGEAVEEAARE